MELVKIFAKIFAESLQVPNNSLPLIHTEKHTVVYIYFKTRTIMPISPELRNRLNIAAEYGHTYYYVCPNISLIKQDFYNGTPEQETMFEAGKAFLDRSEAEKKQANVISTKLEDIRKSLRNENLSYQELRELEALENFIDPSDIELLSAIYLDR